VPERGEGRDCRAVSTPRDEHAQRTWTDAASGRSVEPRAPRRPRPGSCRGRRRRRPLGRWSPRPGSDSPRTRGRPSSAGRSIAERPGRSCGPLSGERQRSGFSGVVGHHARP
jgi:hypothetical protein